MLQRGLYSQTVLKLCKLAGSLFPMMDSLNGNSLFSSFRLLHVQWEVSGQCRANCSRVSLAAAVRSFAFPENIELSGNWAANWPQIQSWNVSGLDGLLPLLHNPSPHHGSGKCDIYLWRPMQSVAWQTGNTDVSNTVCFACVWLACISLYFKSLRVRLEAVKNAFDAIPNK